MGGGQKDLGSWGPAGIMGLCASMGPCPRKRQTAGVRPWFSELGTVSPAVSVGRPAVCASVFTGLFSLQRIQAPAPQSHTC